MVQRHVAFCERHVDLHEGHMLPFMSVMLPFMCAMLPFGMPLWTVVTSYLNHPGHPGLWKMAGLSILAAKQLVVHTVCVFAAVSIQWADKTHTSLHVVCHLCHQMTYAHLHGFEHVRVRKHQLKYLFLPFAHERICPGSSLQTSSPRPTVTVRWQWCRCISVSALCRYRRASWH